MSIQKKRNAKLVVTGCLLKINPKVIYGNVNPYSYILEHQELHKLDNIVHAEIPYEGVPDANIVPDVQDLIGEDSFLLALKKFLGGFQFSRAFVKKIAHGCLGKCTYCAIRFATGTLKSKPTDKIIEEFEKGLAQGYKRFVLSAEDTGCYGLDISTNIVRLLRKICDVEKDFSLILNDFNVNWLIKYYDDLLPLFIKNKDRIEDIRMPIQSGSDKILKSMKRPYKIHDVKRVISDLKVRLPNLRIHTHILVGFPGESAFDFDQSRQLLQELDFTEVSIFRYEERPGTLASLMPGKVPTDVRAQRVTVLEDFQRSLDVKKRRRLHVTAEGKERGQTAELIQNWVGTLEKSLFGFFLNRHKKRI